MNMFYQGEEVLYSTHFLCPLPQYIMKYMISLSLSPNIALDHPLPHLKIDYDYT